MSFFFADGIIYHCDKCKKNQDIAIEEGGKYLSDTKTTLTVLDYEYLKMLEIYK